MQNRPLRKAKTTRASTLVPNCERLRTRAGKSIVDLVDASGVSRDTVGKIEAGVPVKADKGYAVFHVLNDWHKGALSEDKEVVESTSERN